MDPTQIKKIQAVKRLKRRQLVDNLYFYFLSALACSVFCCVTLCLPYLSSLIRVFFLVHISSLIPVLLNTKFLFIIGNIIIFFLVVNSRILYSDPSSTCVVYYDKYIQNSYTMKPQSPIPEGQTLEKCVGENVDMTWEKEVSLEGVGGVEKATEASKEEENIVDEEDEQSLITSFSDELNKRADDFIARVNMQRRLELSLLHYGS